MFDVFAQEVVPTVAPVVAGDWMSGVTAWMSAHLGTVGAISIAILEIVFRVWPSDKIRSILSYAGRLAGLLGKILFWISDLLSKIVPDRRATPPA